MKKSIMIAFFLLFAFVFTLLLILGELKFYVLTPEFIKYPIRENKIYQKLASNPGALIEQVTGQEQVNLFDSMPVEIQELSDVLVKSINAKWLQTEFERAVDAVFEYVLSDQKAVNINIDLRDLKVNLRKNMRVWIETKYNALPQVPLAEYDKIIAEEKSKLPMVRPEGLTLDQAQAKTGFDPVDEIMKIIPDSYGIQNISRNNQDATSGFSELKKLRSAFTGIGIAFYILLPVTIAFLLLAAKLTSKSRLEFVKRLGIYLCAAIVPFVLSVVLKYITVNALIAELMLQVDLSTFARNELIVPVLDSAINRTFLHMQIASGSLVVIGIGLIISSRLMAAKTGISDTK